MTWTVPDPVLDVTAIDVFRAQVREGSTQFDDELGRKLTAAVHFLQRHAAIAYYTTNGATFRRDCFPQRYDSYTDPRPKFYLPPSPLISVESVTYIDTAGAPQTWPDTEYEVITDTKPGFLRPKRNLTYPEGTDVLVSYTVGNGLTWADMPPIWAETALVLGEYYYRDVTLDEDDLRRLTATISVGDEFRSYI